MEGLFIFFGKILVPKFIFYLLVFLKKPLHYLNQIFGMFYVTYFIFYAILVYFS